MKIHFKFCSLIIVILMIGGCVPQNRQAPRVSEPPQKEEPAVQHTNLEGLSPLEAHLRARKMVDPKDTRPTHEYTTLVIPPGQEPPLPVKKPSKHSEFMMARTDLIKSDTPAVKAVAPLPAHIEPASGGYAHQGATSVGVSDVRLGNHPDKTRVVFDLNGKAGFSHVVSEDKRLLTIRLSGAGWNTSLKRDYFDHPYISGYTIKSEGTDSIVKITMKRPVQFIGWAALPPNEGRGHRIYFDLKPS